MTLQIVDCPACKARVVPKRDGSCPSCGAVTFQPRDDVPAEPAVESRLVFPVSNSVSSHRNLTKPLFDPLLHIRTQFVRWHFWGETAFPSVVLVFVCLFFLLIAAGNLSSPYATSLRDKASAAETLTIAATMCLGALFNLAIYLILPRKPVNALYLRSFRTDPESIAVRQLVQNGLGSQFRLSGIRSPKRRWPFWLRVIFQTPFILRYSTPKYMNLEAGADWQVLLWRSLGDVRCVFIDTRDLTSFVESEIRLCLQTVGPERILFIIDDARSRDDAEQFIRNIVQDPSVSAQSFQFAGWSNSPQGRRQFKSAVAGFANLLPSGTTSLDPTTKPVFDQSTAEILPDSGAGFYSFIGLPLLWFSVAFVMIWAFGRSGVIALGIVNWSVWAFIATVFVDYLRCCSSVRDRAIALLTIFPAIVIPLVAAYWAR
jgi:hypothetical protein